MADPTSGGWHWGRHLHIGAMSRVSASFCHRHHDCRHRRLPLEPGGLRSGNHHDHGGFCDVGWGRHGAGTVRLRRRAAATMARQCAGIVRSLLRPTYGCLPCQSLRTTPHAALCPGELHADAVVFSPAEHVGPRRLPAVPPAAGHTPLPSVRRGHRWRVLRRQPLHAGQEAAHDQHRRCDEQRPRHIDDRAAPQHGAE